MTAMNRGYVRQVLAAVSATFFIIGDGMHYGWSAPITPILKSKESPVHDVTDQQIAVMEIMYLIGGLCALPLIIYFPDRIGRKYSIIFGILLNFTSWCLIAIIPNIYVYFLARFLGGMTADIGYVSIPMYVAEISHQSLRGCFTGFVYFGIIIGTILIYIIGPILSIAASASVGVGINTIALALLSFMPESPYYLIKKHRLDVAEKSLRFLRGNADVIEELKDIQDAVKRQEEEKGRFVDLVRDRGNRKALLIMFIVASAPNFAGLTVVVMNLDVIISQSGSILSSQLSSVLFSIVMLIGIVTALGIVDKFGRKNLLGTSAVFTGVALSLLATYSLLKTNHFETDSFNWLPLFAVLLYSASVRLGLGFIPIVLNGELYPTKIKSKGMIWADLCFLISGSVTIYLFEILNGHFGIFVPFYFFALCSLGTAAFSFLYIPETKGKTLEEIQNMLKRGSDTQ